MDAFLKQFPFLLSTRFWALVLIGVSLILQDYGVVSKTYMDFVFTVAGGHIGLRTIDRFGESFVAKK